MSKVGNINVSTVELKAEKKVLNRTSSTYNYRKHDPQNRGSGHELY